MPGDQRPKRGKDERVDSESEEEPQEYPTTDRRDVDVESVSHAQGVCRDDSGQNIKPNLDQGHQANANDLSSEELGGAH